MSLYPDCAAGSAPLPFSILQCSDISLNHAYLYFFSLQSPVGNDWEDLIPLQYPLGKKNFPPTALPLLSHLPRLLRELERFIWTNFTLKSLKSPSALFALFSLFFLTATLTTLPAVLSIEPLQHIQHNGTNTLDGSPRWAD